MTPFKRSGDDREPESTGSAGDHVEKLSRVRPMSHDDEERPSAQDRDFGSTIFTRPPVPLPRLLRGRGKRKGG
jgi:hypothetical protein